MIKETCCTIEDFTKAIGDNTRHKILVLLQENEMNGSEILNYLDVSQPTISYHLAILKRAGLVTSRRKCKYIYYHTNQSCIVDCCDGILNRFNIHLEGIK